MTSEYRSLTEVLVKQREVLSSLLRVLQEGEEGLRHYDAPRVEDYNKTVETIKLRADALEAARRNLVSKIAEEAKIPVRELKLSRLAQMAPHPVSGALDTLKKQITELSLQIQRQNRRNMVLAEASLGIVENLGRLLGQLTGENATYKPFREPGSASGESVTRSV